MKLKSMILFVVSFAAFSASAEIKNQQNVMGGLLIRAGVKMQKPLSDSELSALCEQGVTHAYVLYGGANKSVGCSRGTIQYSGSSDFRMPPDMDRIIDDIRAGLTTKNKTFVHCNNGAHASGYVAAVVLRTFCGMSASSAVKYWEKTLGGYPLQEPNRSRLMSRLSNYPVRQDLELNANEKAAFGCP